MKGKVRFLNHCSASKNPYKFKHSYKQWYNGKEVDAAHNFNHLDYLIFSYENQKLPNTKTSYFKKYHDKFFGPSDKIVDILILRDPFNHFASVLKSGMNVTASYLFSFEELWIDYAFEFLNKTNYLGNNTLKINYNKWVKDNSYKISILQFLNLQQKSNSAVYNKIPKFGGGSSFDNLNYQDRAGNMNVFSRWKHYKTDPSYLKLFQHEEILELANEIYEIDKDLEHFINSNYFLHKAVQDSWVSVKYPIKDALINLALNSSLK